MPIFLLGEEPVFPRPEFASPTGIIAIGGDLSAPRLLNAYASGIFPWYSEGDAKLWWSPDPRMVLFPGEIHISESMKKMLKRDEFKVTVDQCFEEVIERCSHPRKGPLGPGTWISAEIKESYILLHRLGYAHSAEAWKDNLLVGGLYGLSLGKSFFGESMFSVVPNTSKYVFIKFFRHLFKAGFMMVDCQVPNPHLKSLGAREIPRKNFLAMLKKSNSYETIRGKWNFENF